MDTTNGDSRAGEMGLQAEVLGVSVRSEGIYIDIYELADDISIVNDSQVNYS